MQILQGDGWRLELDRSRNPYPVLIGGGNWACELRRPEALRLAEAVIKLQSQHSEVLPLLMAEESLDLEVELSLPAGGSLWMGLAGRRDAWNLRFILAPGDGNRGCEAGWSPQASPAIAAALQQLAAVLSDETESVGGKDQHC